MTADFFDTSLEALSPYLPANLHQQLKTMMTSVALTGSLETGDLNLEAGGNPLYQPNAVAFSRNRLAGFQENPPRLLSRLGGLDPDAQSIADSAMRALLGSQQEQFLHSDPDPGGGYMFLCGIGLGLYLPELLARYDFRDLVIIEESPEFLYFSLKLLDWRKITAEIKQRNGEIHVLVPSSAESAANSIMHIVRGPNFSLLDGSYLFQGYNSPLMNATLNKLQEIKPLLFLPKGFFEDELLMIRNCFSNMKEGSFGLLEDKTDRSIKDIPAFIIGSGPSIDSQMDLIRDMQDRAVIFSGGTSLNSLLSHGIRPDFHCEIENAQETYDGLYQTSLQHDLSGICLIASATVDPRMPLLFDDTVYFFRDTVSSTRAFAAERPVLNMSAPTVTNLASRVALCLGYPQHCLFGVDLGSKEPDRHHSDTSIYALSDDPRWNAGNDMEPLITAIEGARGGTVYTNSLFMLVRSFFEELFSKFPQCQFVNCSDGAHIAGTTAIAPENLVLPRPALTKAEYVARTRAEIETCNAGDVMLLPQRDAFFQACRDWISEANDRLQTADPADFAAIHDALWPLINESTYNERNSPQIAARWTFLGSMARILQTADFLYKRLDTEAGGVLCRSLHKALLDSMPDMDAAIDALDRDCR